MFAAMHGLWEYVMLAYDRPAQSRRSKRFGGDVRTRDDTVQISRAVQVLPLLLSLSQKSPQPVPLQEEEEEEERRKRRDTDYYYYSKNGIVFALLLALIMMSSLTNQHFHHNDQK